MRMHHDAILGRPHHDALVLQTLSHDGGRSGKRRRVQRELSTASSWTSCWTGTSVAGGCLGGAVYAVLLPMKQSALSFSRLVRQ